MWPGVGGCSSGTEDIFERHCFPPVVTASATHGSIAVATDRGAARFHTAVFLVRMVVEEGVECVDVTDVYTTNAGAVIAYGARQRAGSIKLPVLLVLSTTILIRIKISVFHTQHTERRGSGGLPAHVVFAVLTSWLLRGQG